MWCNRPSYPQLYINRGRDATTVPRSTEDLYDSGDDHSVTSGAYAYITLQIKKYVTINGGPCPHPTHWTRETAYNLTDDQYEDAKQNFAVVLDTGATIHAFGIVIY